MGQRSRSSYKGYKESQLPTNGSGSITAEAVRLLHEDLADSVVFIDESIQFVQLDLSSAEILALNTTPKQILPAQGAGTIIQPINITFWLDYGTTPYATNVNLNFQFGTLAAPSLLAAFSSAVTIGQSTGTLQSRNFELTTLDANMINKILGISVATGNPTAGDSTLSIYLSYRVITL